MGVDILDTHTARALLTSLLGRIEPDSVTGKHQLRGVLSDFEVKALRLALEQLGGPIVGDLQPASVVAPVVKLTSPALGLNAPDDGSVILCLDFGTAMSKGFAIRNEEDGTLTLLPLRLGERAGEPQSIHSVSSSLYIDGAGRVFLGTEAVGRGQPSGVRRRIDSLKSFLTLAGVGADLDGKPLGPAVNPRTETVFTEEDALTLYFAYLTDLAASSLEERSISRYVRRRFAVPCWNKERRAWGEKLLRNLLARAVIVSDQFHDRWAAGIPLDEAKSVIDAVKRCSNLPEVLIVEGISEPVAAGSSFLELEEQKHRKVMMVVDVGAGTSDFAMFVVAKSQESEECMLNLIPGSTKALSQAGDVLDSALREAILDKAGLRPSDQQYEYVRDALQHDIRGLKERLCKDGSIDTVLSNGTPCRFTRTEFYDLAKVQEFGQLLRATFDEVVKSVNASHFTHLPASAPLEVLLTGGGSKLDVVRALASGQIRVADGAADRIVLRRQANDFPESLRKASAIIRDDYPILAVAIGGALPNPLSENDWAMHPGGFLRVELGGYYEKGN
jgi:hypothetical protein